MSAKRRPTNPLALAMLALLSERPMHPYEMGALLRERHKQESVKLNYGSLYSVIEALLRQGLIVTQETLRDGRRPERTVYALTAAGRNELLQWMRDLLRLPAKEYPQFAAGLSFLPLLPPSEAAVLLEERGNRLERELEELHARQDAAAQDGLPRLYLVEFEYGMALREAELRWVRGLQREVADGTLGGMDDWRGFHTPSDDS